MKARKPRSYVETLEGSSPRFRRLLRQERLILDVTETLCGLLAREGVTRSELARRLGKTKGFVSQALAGNRNLTLRTIADMFDALGYSPWVAARAARRPRHRIRAARNGARG
jgi:transcriptional regulator with XRE-family HTH domain